jgi:uncharacterized protein (TIGR02266 family)
MREFASRPGRADIEMQVELKVDDDSFVGVTGNIGVGGLFVTTDRPCRVGERIALKLPLPNRDRPLSVAAEVRWTREQRSVNEPRSLLGMGLRFVDLPVGAFISIQELLRARHEDMTPS